MSNEDDFEHFSFQLCQTSVQKCPSYLHLCLLNMYIYTICLYCLLLYASYSVCRVKHKTTVEKAGCNNSVACSLRSTVGVLKKAIHYFPGEVDYWSPGAV